jgi:hypothetical protein
MINWNDPTFEDAAWNSAEFLNMFVAAILERNSAADVAAVNVGEDIQGLVWSAAMGKYRRIIGRLQEAAWELMSSYSPPGTGMALDPWSVTLEKLGISAAGFRRVTDSGEAVGIIQAGDYVGPWLFTQMRDLLNNLVRRVQGCTVSAESISYRISSALGHATWAEAKAYVDAGGDPWDGPSTGEAATYGWIIGGYFHASRGRCRVLVEYSDDASHPASGGRDVSLYVNPRRPVVAAPEYDSGDLNLPELTWTLWDRARLAGPAVLHWSVECPLISAWCNEPASYLLNAARGVMLNTFGTDTRFDVEGGFVYRGVNAV